MEEKEEDTKEEKDIKPIHKPENMPNENMNTPSKEKGEKDEEDSKNDTKFDYNPQRQSYCFIYYIKKLTE